MLHGLVLTCGLQAQLCRFSQGGDRTPITRTTTDSRCRIDQQEHGETMVHRRCIRSPPDQCQSAGRVLHSKNCAKRYPSKSGARVTDATRGVSSVACNADTFSLWSTNGRPAVVALRMSSARCLAVKLHRSSCPLTFPFLALLFYHLRFMRVSTSMGEDPVAKSADLHDIHHFVRHHRTRCESLALPHQVVPQGFMCHVLQNATNLHIIINDALRLRTSSNAT